MIIMVTIMMQNWQICDGGGDDHNPDLGPLPGDHLTRATKKANDTDDTF